MTEDNETNDASKLKWITISKFENKTFLQKLKLKFFENPFVFFGSAATVAALSTGIYYFFKHDSKKQQNMMRYRVLAQGFTVVVASISMLAPFLKKKET